MKLENRLFCFLVSSTTLSFFYKLIFSELYYPVFSQRNIPTFNWVRVSLYVHS